MSTHAMNETNVAAQELATVLKRSGWRGVLVGLIPLGLLASIVGTYCHHPDYCTASSTGAHFTPASRTVISPIPLQNYSSLVFY